MNPEVPLAYLGLNVHVSLGNSQISLGFGVDTKSFESRASSSFALVALLRIFCVSGNSPGT